MLRSTRRKAQALWGTKGMVFIFHGEMGQVKADLGLGRGAEILLRGLFLQLGPPPLTLVS